MINFFYMPKNDILTFHHFDAGPTYEFVFKTSENKIHFRVLEFLRRGFKLGIFSWYQKCEFIRLDPKIEK